MMQEALVAAIVACAVFALVRRYLPRIWQTALRQRGAYAAMRLGWARLAQKLDQPESVRQDCGSGCQTCNACNTRAPEAGQKQIFLKKQ